jgi:hypothetical protein
MCHKFLYGWVVTLVGLSPTTTSHKNYFHYLNIVVSFCVVNVWNIGLNMNKLIVNYMQLLPNTYVILT